MASDKKLVKKCGCHSMTFDRKQFYRALSQYSETDVGEVSPRGNGLPRTEQERRLIGEWCWIDDIISVDRLGQNRELLLSLESKEQSKLIRAEQLTISAMQHIEGDFGDIRSILTHLKESRTRYYKCDSNCNDTRCICGNESGLCYAYNKTKNIVLGLGTTCINNVGVLQVSYRQCVCGKTMPAFCTKNGGRCSDCKKRPRVKSGIRRGDSIEDVARSPDNLADLDLLFCDHLAIAEIRSRTCEVCRKGKNITHSPISHRAICSSCLVLNSTAEWKALYPTMSVMLAYLTDVANVGLNEKYFEYLKGVARDAYSIYYTKRITEQIGSGKYSRYTYSQLMDEMPSQFSHRRMRYKRGDGTRLNKNMVLFYIISCDISDAAKIRRATLKETREAESIGTVSEEIGEIIV